MSLKRSPSGLETLSGVPTLRRTKPTRITYTRFSATNIEDGEVLHQACLLVKGVCHSFDNSGDDFIAAAVTDCFETKSPAQQWPVDRGQWKALVMLSPGRNRVCLEFFHAGGVCDTVSLSLDYVPLLQLPPLHLAILVAQDSPLLIDCPPTKRGAVLSAHSTLDAAVSKFRLTAYMWQALTAADAHSKGLGRRSFRLDEGWGQSTITHPRPVSSLGSYAKVHIVRTEKTVAQLRNANLAQQNYRATRAEALHKIFENALKTYGAPFESESRPVVAGLMLDSAYSMEQNLILGHAALGCHKPDGLSLGIFGSHLTYAWPRFMEEIPACLMDESRVGDTVGNDNNECNTFQEACQVGQGAFLHEVGHAFGAEHTTGIMARGYSKHWRRAFLGSSSTKNDASWDLQDLLTFMSLPQFLLPGEKLPTREFSTAGICVSVDSVPKLNEDDDDKVKITCAAGLARVQYIAIDSDAVVKEELFGRSGVCTTYFVRDLAFCGLRTYKNLKLNILANNGTVKAISNIWRVLAEKPYVSIRDHSWRLNKQSILGYSRGDSLDHEVWEWTNLLYKKDAAGIIHRATAIDLRVGCTLDGAVIYYADGSPAHCGPNYTSKGRVRVFGGHASKCCRIPAGAEIAKVELNTGSDGRGGPDGIRITLDNGAAWGELNIRSDGRWKSDITTLTPPLGERIVGFFGKHNGWDGYTRDFGILTAPKEVDVLPDEVFGMEELRNTDGGLGKVEGAEMPTRESCAAYYRHDQWDEPEMVQEVCGDEHGNDDDGASEDSEDYDDMQSEHTVA
nr:putative zinc metalloproteinase [Quercus suber]